MSNRILIYSGGKRMTIYGSVKELEAEAVTDNNLFLEERSYIHTSVLTKLTVFLEYGPFRAYPITWRLIPRIPRGKKWKRGNGLTNGRENSDNKSIRHEGLD